MTTIGSLVNARPVFSVQLQAKVVDAVRIMAEKNVGALAVLEGSLLVGIFSERDVVTRVVAKQLDPRFVPVKDVMTKQLVVADAAESDEACLRKMKAANCRHLPIVSGDKLVGMISLRDLLLAGLTERDEKLEYLTSYLFHLSPDAGEKSQ